MFRCLLIGLLGGILLAGQLLLVDDRPQKADAIVVIGGDHKPERVSRAVELYQQGYAPVVIISAGTQVLEGIEYLPEAQVMQRQAMMLGLPEGVQLIEDQSQSTFQNAYYTKAICDDLDVRSVLLVTSAYHSRRARRIFREVFGPGIIVIVQPAPQTLCTPCWWFQRDQATVVLYEYRNWVRYWLGIRSPHEMPPY